MLRDAAFSYLSRVPARITLLRVWHHNDFPQMVERHLGRSAAAKRFGLIVLRAANRVMPSFGNGMVAIIQKGAE